ncbi:MAG: hypothetical protein AB8I08_15245 [Sandaracinaceae bacterium]
MKRNFETAVRMVILLACASGGCDATSAGMDARPADPDGGTSMESDAGAQDAGTQDAGTPGRDSGSPPDAGDSSDAGVAEDAGLSDDAGPADSDAGPGSPSGFPDTTNTGVPVGTSLRTCDSNITAPGVYDGCHFTGIVTIHTDNVTIRRSLIDGIVRTDLPSTSNVLFEDVEVDAHDDIVYNAVSLPGYTCRRCQVHDARVCFGGTGMTIEDSYCFDLHGRGDPATSGTHNEAIIASGTDPIVIRRNNLVSNWNATTTGGGMSAVIAIYANDGFWGPLGNVLVEGNRIENTAGAYYCMYTSQTHRGPTGFRVRDNVFVHADSVYGLGCASPTYPDWVRGAGNVWTGNETESGASLSEPPSS